MRSSHWPRRRPVQPDARFLIESTHPIRRLLADQRFAGSMGRFTRDFSWTFFPAQSKPLGCWLRMKSYGQLRIGPQLGKIRLCFYPLARHAPADMAQEEPTSDTNQPAPPRNPGGGRRRGHRGGRGRGPRRPAPATQPEQPAGALSPNAPAPEPRAPAVADARQPPPPSARPSKK